eukprot:169631-Pleurochrysis_carterae.AAC.1
MPDEAIAREMADALSPPVPRVARLHSARRAVARRPRGCHVATSARRMLRRGRRCHHATLTSTG